MADVSIKYKGFTIAEMSDSGTKTLNTSGKYCEDNIVVQYETTGGESDETVNTKVVDFTVSKASGWVKLVTLDSEVLSHINDDTFNVLLVCKDAYSYVFYAIYRADAGNVQCGLNKNGHPIYGTASLQTGEKSVNYVDTCVPANNTNSSIVSGSMGFRLSGNDYYFMPRDGYFIGGNCRLIFSW